MIRRLTRLLPDSRGATVVEFALVAPILAIAVLGLLELGYNMYTAAVLEGTVQAAARSSTLEGASSNASTIDAAVTSAVKDVVPNATVTFQRTAYPTFSDVGKPEDYTDTNGNNRCDNGEPYEDANNNGTWDSDRGSNGTGGARDVVVYQVNVSYPRVLSVAGLFGGSGDYQMTTKTVLANQPWDNVKKSPAIRNCK